MRGGGIERGWGESRGDGESVVLWEVGYCVVVVVTWVGGATKKLSDPLSHLQQLIALMEWKGWYWL